MTDTLNINRVMGSDALTCLGAGLVMTIAAGPLAPLTGLPETLLTIAGIALFPVALLFGVMARMPTIPQALLWLAVVGNAGWVAASVAVMALFPATPFGYVFVAVQAAVVLVLALLEASALRATRAALI